ncbi:hypothetical protein [Sediminibacillus albus]|uniref:Uncharacterized protein n=1 Tax=Sediminibacillus albus TaxID=407036 RepID=A0A1G9B9A9_9BACI|nr:hypothetical protein [Sediminibacillus albus]SDK36088.1 hypothetical protein SAMN05216243_2891 [Sediminibacillus albus]
MPNQKRNIIILIFFICAFLLSGCDSKNKMDYYDDTKSTDLSQARIHTITINATEQQVRKEFGEPDFIEEVENPEATYYIYGNDKEDYSLDVMLTDGKVKRFFIGKDVFNSEIATLIGKSKEEIVKLLGNDYYERNDTGSVVIGYFDKSHQKNIELIMDETVTGIIVSEIP